jgi:hypothetical protein
MIRRIAGIVVLLFGLLSLGSGQQPVTVVNANPNGQATMANSAPVAIASNQGAIPASESGTWNVQLEDASGNGLTSNSTTFTLKHALDINLLGSLGTAFTTPGFFDIKAADGNVFVRQATASNLNAQVVGAAADGSAASGNPVLVAGKGSGNARVHIVCDNWAPFSLASTTSLKIITKSGGKNIYICSINIVTATANNVALIAGTKTSTDCDTSTAGLAGGTTAATGWNFAANGGLTQGTGIGVIAATASTGLDVCLLASGSGQVSGVISWTQF